MTYFNRSNDIDKLKETINIQEKTITNLYSKYIALKQQSVGSFIPKFNIDQEVWVITKNNADKFPRIIKDKIKEIRIVKNREMKYLLYNNTTNYIYPTEQKANLALKTL